MQYAEEVFLRTLIPEKYVIFERYILKCGRWILIMPLVDLLREKWQHRRAERTRGEESRRKVIRELRESREAEIRAKAEQLWKENGSLEGKKAFYRRKVEESYIGYWFKWVLWDFLPFRVIWERICPPIDEKGKRVASSFILWVLGIHFAALGLASSRHEARKDLLETRLNIFVAQLATDARLEALRGAVILQQSRIPIKPKIWPPLSVYLSLFGSEKPDPEIINSVKRLIETRKRNLSEAYLREAILFRANLWGANLREAYLREADLREAYLERAYLGGARNLAPKQIKLACDWETAIYKGNESENTKYIEELKKDKPSDPKEPPDCSTWNN